MEVKKEKYESDADIPFWLKERFLVTLMLGLGMSNAYVMRTNMSVAIVAMVNKTAINPSNNETSSTDMTEGEFVWSYKLQGYILASFFYGYVMTQIPFGILTRKYSAKLFLGWGMMINSVAAFLVPTSARKGGYIGICVVRFIQGLGEGPIVPCTHSMLAQWIPPNERSRCGAFVYSGAQFGTIVSMSLSGLLAVHGFDGGWPSIFYVFGTVSCLWSLLFLYFVSANPTASKRLSNVERNYIFQALLNSDVVEADEKVQLLSIFKSLPFWAILFAHMGQNYGYETLMTELPTYMSSVMRVDIKLNGVLSSLPYLAMWLMAILLAILADKMIQSGISITVTRKVMNSFGEFGPAISLFAAGYCHSSLLLTMTVFIIGIALNGAIYSGFKINHLDISPKMAGLLISITNCFANLIGIAAPIVAGHIVSNDPSVDNWRIVFFIAGLVYVICATFYLIFGSGKRQL